MNEHPADDILQDLALELLAANAARPVAAHVAGCALCQARFGRFQTESAGWRQRLATELGQQHPSAGANFGPIAAELSLHNKRKNQMNRMMNLAVVGAALLLIVLGVYVFRPADEQPAVAPPAAEVATATPTAVATLPPTLTPTATPATSLLSALQNLTYAPFGGDTRITLVDGAIGDVTLDSYQFGDLNGDGLADAAFIVVKHQGESRLVEVGAALNDGAGGLVHVANEFLWPDITATVAIVGSQIVVSMESESGSAPSTITYVVADGRLRQPEAIAGEAVAEAQYYDYFQTGWDAGESAPAGSFLTRETLSNMVYQTALTLNGTTPLIGGIYRELPRTTVYLQPQHAYGDLNGDGLAEAAVILGTNTGGSGFWLELIVVAEQDGQPVQVASAPLQELASIVSLTVAEGQLVVTYAADALVSEEVYSLNGAVLTLVNE